MEASEVVITGIGVVSPIGIGKEAFWQALLAGHCGIGPVTLTPMPGMAPPLAAEVRDFEAKEFIANRKSLKVMARDAQLGIAASTLACRDAGIGVANTDPSRFGVVLGADQICARVEESEAIYAACMVDGRFDFQRWGTEGMRASFPLGLLRVLPNMIASHVSIAQDARGPNNTIHEGEISSLLAVAEATSVIVRGMADVMIAGGASSQMHPFDFFRRTAMGKLSQSVDPSAAVRPFDARRDGYLWGEGAAAVILENRRHAEARGARIVARVKGCGAAFEPVNAQGQLSGDGLRRAIAAAMQKAEATPDSVGHVKAHGLSTVHGDAMEAAVLGQVLPQTLVTALKGHFGNVGAAGAVMELAATALAVEHGCVPAVRNYEYPDPACPLRIVRGEPLSGISGDAVCLSWMPFGQAAAVVLGR